LKTPSKLIINLIQDLATPHNNFLIEQFKERKDVSLKLWYAASENNMRYQWSNDITNQFIPASIYGNRLNLSFLLYCLSHRHERFVIVGWMNINTILLHFLFFILRRPFNHWTDLPSPIIGSNSSRKKILRWLAYRVLKYSNCKLFCVGKPTIDHFRTMGFRECKLVNLPIFMKIDEDLTIFQKKRHVLTERYDVPVNGHLLSAGSRLIHQKGFDLLIQAFYMLPENIKIKIRLVIVGSGEEEPFLRQQIEFLNLQHIIYIENWMDFQDFKTIIAHSDIFFHPARFDAYGGTTLGMALGVPVIGSTGAGAAVDRIVHGVNGFLYDPDDIQTLALLINNLLSDYSLRKRIGNAGRATALLWPPSRGADILVKYSI
jgi:glycosyltransferase involved in cell wall biosynthesis